MAATEVIRVFTRRRLSYHRHWFQCDTIPNVQRDLNGSHGLILRNLISSNGSSDLDDCQEATGPSHGCSLKFGKADLAANVEMDRGERGGGGGTLTATMASQARNPSSLTPSGVYAGGGRDGEQNQLHALPLNFSFSDLSSRSNTEEDICLEDLSALSLSEDNTGGQSNLSWNQCVTHLLAHLQQFGVSSNPVPYRPQEHRLDSKEIFCKNLFLKDRRGTFFMVICDENQDMDLKSLRRKLKAYRNFSFATADEMAAILQVQPGGVTPFALLHGTARDVRVVMTTDLTLDPEALLNFHPLDQNLTLPIILNQLEKFLQHYRIDLEFIDMND